MGAFNTVVGASLPCPTCRTISPQRVQFKYGQTWQHVYAIGDAVRWGRPAHGIEGRPAIVVDGVVEGSCPSCGFDEWDAYVFLSRDHIVKVTSADGRYAWATTDATWLEIAVDAIPPR